MSTTCFGPPPLPPNKRPIASAKEGLQRKNSFTQAGSNRTNASLTSSTYMSFKDPLDEILVLSSEDLPSPTDKNPSKKCHHHHKRKNSLKKCKHALNLSLSKFTEDRTKRNFNGDVSFKSSSLVNGFDRSYASEDCPELDRARCELSKQYFLHSPDEPSDSIPLKTFSEIFSRGCEDLSAVDDDSRNKLPYATVKSSPFARPHSVGRASFHTNSLTRSFRGFGEMRFSLARSSSEGNLATLDKEVPLSLSPLGSRRVGLPQHVQASAGSTTLNKCLRVLSGSWRNLFQCESF